MGASFRAEAIKLRRRAAPWVLASILLLAVILLGYVLPYVAVVSAPGGEAGQVAPGPRVSREDQIGALLPDELLSTVLPFFSGMGGAMALILGALVVGSEYGWGTLKTVLTQRPSRTEILAGYLAVLATVLLIIDLAMLGAGALGGSIVALSEGVAVSWPTWIEVAKGAASLWLIFMTWATLGVFLAFLFRSSSLAIGLGLVYALVIENVIGVLPIQTEAVEAVRKALMGQNSGHLANSFGSAPTPVEPAQAALVLAAYVTAFSLLSALLLRRRDVT